MIRSTFRLSSSWRVVIGPLVSAVVFVVSSFGSAFAVVPAPGSQTTATDVDDTETSTTVAVPGTHVGRSVIVTFAMRDPAGTQVAGDFGVTNNGGNTFTVDAISENSGNVLVVIFSAHNVSTMSGSLTVTHPAAAAGSNRRVVSARLHPARADFSA